MYEAITQQLRDDTLEGVYLTWLISALALGVILLPVFKTKMDGITIDNLC